MSRSLARHAFVAFVAVIALATCGRDAAAPHQPAAIAVAASLPPGLDLAAFNLIIDHVRLIARNSSGDTAFNQLYTFPANQTSLSLQADLPLAQSPEAFQVTIELLSGTTLLFSGTQTFRVSSGSNNPTAQIPVTYAGPGQNVASLVLGPLDSLLTEGTSLQFRVSARDAVGATVPSFYVSWTTSDTVAAPIDATGTLKAPLSRRSITVQARAFPDTTIKASTTLQFIPALSAVSFDSGCGQSGLPGVQLSQPIVARVLGTDGLGVPGVQVAFSAITTGGIVATPTAITDTGGRARTLVTLPSAVGPAQFQASVTGLTAAVCSPTVLSAPPTQLAFKTQPASSVAGATLGSIQVEVRDASGALVTGATNPVTIAVKANPGGATLSGATTVNASGGVATFNNLSLDKVATGYTLAATASGLTSATSSTFSIAAGALSQLAFTTQPANMVAGSVFPAVIVAGQDAFGNTVPSFTGNVTLAFGSHPTSATTLGGTTMVPAAAGVASFNSLGPLTVAGGYTLVASSSGVGSRASNSFTVSPGAAAMLAFQVQPTGGFAGATITPSVVVAVEDSLGNVDTSATNPVSMAFGLNPGQATLGGTLTVNAASGIAKFTSLTVSLPASGYTLLATAAGLASATSLTFDEVLRLPGITWTNTLGGNWSTASNWSPARVPGTSDTVSIIAPGTYVVTLDVNDTVLALTVGGGTTTGATLAFDAGRNLRVDSLLTVQTGGFVTLPASDTISGPGNLVNQGSMSLTSSAVTLQSLSNLFALNAAGASVIQGTFTNSSSSALIISASGGDATLTLTSPNGFLNTGGIVLENTDGTTARNVTLAVPSGVFTNVAGGSLQTDAPTNGGNRTLAALLDNQGAVYVSHTLTIDQANATHGNSGQIVLTGGDLDVVLSGTAPAFTNESNGTIDVVTNKLVITNQSTGTFTNQSGGTLRGAGTIDVGTATFSSNGAVTVGEGAPGILAFIGAYSQGPTTGTLNVYLTSPATPGTTFSQFQVSNGVTLSDTLNASMPNYTAGSYPIITVPAGKSISGDFTTKILPISVTGAPCTGSVVGGTQYVITCP